MMSQSTINSLGVQRTYMDALVGSPATDAAVARAPVGEEEKKVLLKLDEADATSEQEAMAKERKAQKKAAKRKAKEEAETAARKQARKEAKKERKEARRRAKEQQLADEEQARKKPV